MFCRNKTTLPRRVAVPEKLRPILLAEAHSGRFSGHFAEKGLLKCYLEDIVGMVSEVMFVDNAGHV